MHSHCIGEMALRFSTTGRRTTGRRLLDQNAKALDLTQRLPQAWPPHLPLPTYQPPINKSAPLGQCIVTEGHLEQQQPTNKFAPTL